MDFLTPGTGSTLATTPLTTTAGTITASAIDGLLFTSTSPGSAYLAHRQGGSDSDFGQLAFDFDVTQISFGYFPDTGGILAQVLDASFNVLDTFTDSDTGTVETAVLNGAAIRYFRWSDQPGGGSFSGLTSMALTAAPAAVPLPAGLPLLGAGFLCLFTLRRNQARKSVSA
ncbi:MAG: hypothetical protein ABJ263_01070 [Tateyamaria sp.]|uniref:hypothetical protein n=1 Tax=Tateyamaria sp. TaxID=1929288 RepID=UPI0032893439